MTDPTLLADIDAIGQQARNTVSPNVWGVLLRCHAEITRLTQAPEDAEVAHALFMLGDGSVYPSHARNHSYTGVELNEIHATLSRALSESERKRGEARKEALEEAAKRIESSPLVTSEAALPVSTIVGPMAALIRALAAQEQGE